MREILFRGKSNDGKWVYGTYFHKTKFYGEKIDEHLIIEHGEFDYDHYDAFEVVPETVGQYTGLADKNGTKIFEGDIVKYTEFYKFSDNEDLEFAEEKSESISAVKFVNGRFKPLPTRQNCEDYWYSYAEDDFEVIGNIHDNPELLKGGAQ